MGIDPLLVKEDDELASQPPIEGAVCTKAKDQLFDFLKTCPIGRMYRFTHVGNEQSARMFVQAMRTDLTRRKQMVLARGKKVTEFKIILQAIEPIADRPLHVHVTLHRRAPGGIQINTDETAEMIANLIQMKD